MKNAATRIKKFRPTTLVALMALFVAIGGTATAASGLINGKKIQKGTITAKQVKNKTITKGKLTPAAVKALTGPRGEKGEKGAQGPKGDTGPAGAAGPKVVTSYSVDNNVSNIPANDKVDVISLNNLPSSKYLVIAKAVMFSNVGGNMLRCAIESNNGGGGDEAQWTSPGNLTRTTVPMVLSTATKVTQVKVQCNPGDAMGSFNVDAVAIPIG